MRRRATTKRNIEKAVEEGASRSDLLYRINVVPIYIPPLRERGDDIKLLAQYFITRFAREFKKPVSGIDEAVYRKLSLYSWPGNVRELRNAAERAVLLLTGDTITTDDIMLGRPE